MQKKINNKRITKLGLSANTIPEVKKRKETVVLIKLVSGGVDKKESHTIELKKKINKMKQRRARAGRKKMMKNLLRKSEN